MSERERERERERASKRASERASKRERERERERASERASKRERERTRERERESERERACYPRPISGTAQPRAQEHRCRAGAVCSAARSWLTARFLKCVLLSALLSSNPCSVAPSTLAHDAPMQHPHRHKHREVPRRSSGAARKDSATTALPTAPALQRCSWARGCAVPDMGRG